MNDQNNNEIGSNRAQLLPRYPANEIRIAVPWGHIAAKEYGNPSGLPVLAIHGWLDNCGSFEPLIPYLMQAHNLHIVSIDEPGCGLSSHKPVGADYGRWSTVKEMKRVIDHMGWRTVSLLGHSQGAHYSLLFAAIYPKMVERVISLDMVKPMTFFGRLVPEYFANLISSHLRYDEKFMIDATLESSAVVYEEAAAVKKLIESSAYSLNEQTARIMMERGSKILPNGLTFSRDIRLRLRQIDPPPTNEFMLKLMANVKCDLLVVASQFVSNVESKRIVSAYVEVYKTNCRLFRYVEVDGTHHVHMNDPATVAPIVNSFIEESLNAGPLTRIQSKL
ncbi:serine hydrolase-like protein [Dinothrombium tinctorium]|uniref:Serine hydrolase-like protein n=1 Tax=Dinothrombium tinctorium TaxID=1965070 RepID=A0A3S3SCA7_9ACAR|nr:serine hydrolase-like protein [Dinothrombium tinctorium]